MKAAPIWIEFNFLKRPLYGHILFYHTQAGPLISLLKLLFGEFCFINIFSKYTKNFQGRLLEIQSQGEGAPAPKPKNH
jgi:hypothetical protein